MNRERFLVKSYGDNKEGTKVGLAKMLEALKALDSGATAAIVVPSIGHVKDTLLVDVLGEDVAKRLINNRVLEFDDKSKLVLCACATLKNYTGADVYLALWGTETTIMSIEKLWQWKTAVLVTWLPQDSEKWVATYSVKTIYDDGH